MDEFTDDSKDMLWDLRQYYAKVTGESLVDLAQQMKNNDFYNWFESCEDLRTLTEHKWGETKDEKANTIKEYNRLKGIVITLSNKYPAAWGKRSNDAKQINEIMLAMREWTIFLMNAMQDGGLFGRKAFDDSGL